jgi:hypothetical protein
MTLTTEHAEVRRDLGIERAGEHADRVDEGWTDRAAACIAVFAVRVNRPFLIEELRSEAEAEIGPPPDERAWGAATQKAARAKAIKKVGYALANSSNRSPKVQWSAP